MKSLLVGILLTIPPPDKMVDWTVNKVPTQVQIIYKYGLEVSHNAVNIPCNSKLETPYQILFRVDSDYMVECYMVLDWREPNFIRYPNQWLPVNLKEVK
tara:strand:- start:9943 stop:10239 length:297 start_codon:yes stop_codon:yes gene_type:complete